MQMFIEYIMLHATEKDIQTIHQTISQRAKMKLMEAQANFGPGTRIFTVGVKPQYLSGMWGTVVKVITDGEDGQVLCNFSYDNTYTLRMRGGKYGIKQEDDSINLKIPRKCLTVRR